MALKLMRTSTLVIKRDGGSGFWDEKGRWVTPTPVDITIQCSIQPFKMGANQLILPSGKTASDARIIRTTTSLNTSDQFSKELADTTTIEGQNYYAMAVENWNLSGLSTDHFKALFIRDDQTTNGGL
jgi:hypothetical protein